MQLPIDEATPLENGHTETAASNNKSIAIVGIGKCYDITINMAEPLTNIPQAADSLATFLVRPSYGIF